MTWSQAIENAIISMGYYATLKQIYPIAIALKGDYNGLTPEKTIQERVQRDPRFYKIMPGLYGLNNHLEQIPIDYQPDEILRKVVNTTKISETSQRIGQELFRRKLLERQKECPITGISNSRLLIASHIKPWRASNDQERLDTNNGFIFSPTIDKLFDIGLISFENDKSILISKKLDKLDANVMGLTKNAKYETLPLDGKLKYLDYHRNFVFLD